MDLEYRVIGYRILISFYISIDAVWNNTMFTPHWNYKVYCNTLAAQGAIKDMQNSGEYSTSDEFKIEALYTKI